MSDSYGYGSYYGYDQGTFDGATDDSYFNDAFPDITFNYNDYSSFGFDTNEAASFPTEPSAVMPTNAAPAAESSAEPADISLSASANEPLPDYEHYENIELNATNEAAQSGDPSIPAESSTAMLTNAALVAESVSDFADIFTQADYDYYASMGLYSVDETAQPGNASIPTESSPAVPIKATLAPESHTQSAKIDAAKIPAESFSAMLTNAALPAESAPESTEITTGIILAPPSAFKKKKRATSQLQPPTDQQSNLSPIGANGLRFTSLAEAQAFAASRVPVQVSNDDFAAMEANPVPHVRKIMQAFSAPLATSPDDYPLSPTRAAQWAAYQNRSASRADKIICDDASRPELAAWLIFSALVDVHKLGAKASFSPPTEKCSLHLERLLQPIRDFAIIRIDLLRLQRVDELVGNVQAAVTRKLSNFKGNGRKTTRDVENAARAAAGGIVYEKVLGTKRKRKVDESVPTQRVIKNAKMGTVGGAVVV